VVLSTRSSWHKNEQVLEHGQANISGPDDLRGKDCAFSAKVII
jgi:hypothetical protein